MNEKRISKTPQNPEELDFQTNHINNRIVRHQYSSPTWTNEAFDRLAKGAQVKMHSAVLRKAESQGLTGGKSA